MAAAKTGLRDRLTREIASLKDRDRDHEKRESANRADAAWRIAVDLSPSGQAMSRYEARQHREFHSALRDLVMLRKSDVKEAPVVTDSADPPARNSMSWPDFEPETTGSLFERVEIEEPDGFEGVLSPAPDVVKSVLEPVAPNEPEPAIEAATDAPKSCHWSRLGSTEEVGTPSPELIWVAELGTWFVKGTIDLEEVERIAERRRANNVWSERDFLPRGGLRGSRGG